MQSSGEGHVGRKSNLQAPDIAISIPKEYGAIKVGAQGCEGGLQEGRGQAQAALSQMTGLQLPRQHFILNKYATQDMSHGVQPLSHLDTRPCCFLHRLGQVMLHDQAWLDDTAETHRVMLLHAQSWMREVTPHSSGLHCIFLWKLFGNPSNST